MSKHTLVWRVARAQSVCHDIHQMTQNWGRKKLGEFSQCLSKTLVATVAASTFVNGHVQAFACYWTLGIQGTFCQDGNSLILPPINPLKKMHRQSLFASHHEPAACLPHAGNDLTPFYDLRSLLSFKSVAVQCPDSPSADTVAAAWGLYLFFKTAGKNVKLFHMGHVTELAPNVREMLVQLDIPLEHSPQLLHWRGLLMTVGGAASQCSSVSADAHFLFDTRLPVAPLPNLYEVRPYLSSCATLVWLMLEQAGFAVNEKLGTALVYALHIETNGFKEIRFPSDKDMRDMVPINARLFAALERANLSLHDLALTAQALNALNYHAEERCVLVNVLPCDASILGFIGDLSMRVSGVDTAVVFAESADGLRFCVRSAVREIKALDLAQWLAGQSASTVGGDKEQAGGWIYDTVEDPVSLCLERMRAYRAAYDIIDCATANPINARGGRAYQKLPVSLGFVPTDALAPPGTRLHIRMLEGDIVVPVAVDTLLMIGLEGEVYPIQSDVFDKKYAVTESPLQRCFRYPPAVLAMDKKKRTSLLPHARQCVSREDRVLACELKHRLKLFTLWDNENYLRGEPGDWLVQTKHNPQDQYIVKKSVFEMLYSSVK